MIEDCLKNVRIKVIYVITLIGIDIT